VTSGLPLGLFWFLLGRLFIFLPAKFQGASEIRFLWTSGLSLSL
jgi:hypothetical protein